MSFAMHLDVRPKEWIWIAPTGDAVPPIDSERKLREFYHPTTRIERMPRKGELCPLAAFRGLSLTYSRERRLTLSRFRRKLAQSFELPHGLHDLKRSPSTPRHACTRFLWFFHGIQLQLLALSSGRTDAIVSATRPNVSIGERSGQTPMPGARYQ
jgi:hypothetical protein